jgi:hypothetical protein
VALANTLFFFSKKHNQGDLWSFSGLLVVLCLGFEDAPWQGELLWWPGVAVGTITRWFNFYQSKRHNNGCMLLW